MEAEERVVFDAELIGSAGSNSLTCGADCVVEASDTTLELLFAAGAAGVRLTAEDVGLGVEVVTGVLEGVLEGWVVVGSAGLKHCQDQFWKSDRQLTDQERFQQAR